MAHPNRQRGGVRRVGATTGWHDERARAAHRHRRMVLRAHHPDLGGDPAEFIRQVAALHARAGSSAPEGVTFVRRPRGLAVLARWARTLGRRSRTEVHRQMRAGALRRRIARLTKHPIRLGRPRAR